MSAHDAIRQAALLRFRPIMMTTIAALLGGVPLMLGHGTGSEIRQPLGYAMVGGLIVSQALTLFTTPVIYLYLDELSDRMKAWRASSSGKARAATRRSSLVDRGRTARSSAAASSTRRRHQQERRPAMVDLPFGMRGDLGARRAPFLDVTDREPGIDQQVEVAQRACGAASPRPWPASRSCADLRRDSRGQARCRADARRRRRSGRPAPARWIVANSAPSFSR